MKFSIKNTASAIVLNLYAAILFAQVPNGNFDVWINKGTYDVPDQWGTMNNTTPKDSAHTIEKGNPGNPAAYYMQIISRTMGNSVVNGIAVCGKLDTITMEPKSGFAYTGRPKSFTGKREFMWLISPGLISVTLTKWNATAMQRETIATAIDTLEGMVMGFEVFDIDFSYLSNDNPDTCIILLKANCSTAGDGDYLFIDNLAFSGASVSVPENFGFVTNIDLYPNPAEEQVVVQGICTTVQQLQLKMFDVTGRTVWKEIFMAQGNFKKEINVSTLPPGIYQVSLSDKKYMKLVKY